ncbi:hypothetical protein FVEN_g12697 [Fusarium venenatum]|uniref:Uncharacterized protein n=1 Tax=Fusarium venenatum TaxID=56646 RepID=A0A2L2SU67_9HYPO|nr:uncharacterized protein FVRRES_05380 [Fusarium venenatum]KAG8359830.1 hypothetical protein FVEN_g12697 [Fusarium venenatum]CEI60944.1 unnamed protein product [Fusarium venenatum]
MGLGLVPMPVPAVAGSKRQSRPSTKGLLAHLMLAPVISIPFTVQTTFVLYMRAVAALAFSTCRTTPRSGLKAGTRGLPPNITKARCWRLCAEEAGTRM